MPLRSRHLEFDDVLRMKGVICEDTNGDSVHPRLDKGSKKYAEAHRDLDYFHSDSGIRDFVDNIINSIGNIYPETATDYVRIAHGHLCLDYMASKLKRKLGCSYDELDWEYVFRQTWKYFKYRGFQRAYHRERY